MKLFKTLSALSTGLMLSLTPSLAHADLKIFATVPEWGALAETLGGDKVKVYTATTGMQDPHRIQARPSLIAKARSANLLIATGGGLEIGWLPTVQREANNAGIMPNQPGFIEVSRYVQMLDIPAVVDRTMGDVHAEGNPHIQTDPRNLLPIAKAISARMQQLDPENATYYHTQLSQFNQSWQANLQRWQKQAAPIRGVKVWYQHDGYPYMNAWLGLNQVGVLEPHPGVEPSSRQLADILQRQQSVQGRMVIAPAYLNDAPAKWLSEKAGIPVVVLPFTVGGNEQAKTLAALYDDTMQRLLVALK
ncbi:MAG: zinc transporter substrate-binding protein [Pseudomonadota bacterium]|jgi:zinc/manganese transport system substrate-binding protein